jgi:hypothetical protein
MNALRTIRSIAIGKANTLQRCHRHLKLFAQRSPNGAMAKFTSAKRLALTATASAIAVNRSLRGTRSHARSFPPPEALPLPPWSLDAIDRRSYQPRLRKSSSRSALTSSPLPPKLCAHLLSPHFTGRAGGTTHALRRSGSLAAGSSPLASRLAAASAFRCSKVSSSSPRHDKARQDTG